MTKEEKEKEAIRKALRDRFENYFAVIAKKGPLQARRDDAVAEAPLRFGKF